MDLVTFNQDVLNYPEATRYHGTLDVHLAGFSEAVVQRCSVKRCSWKFHKIHKNHLCQSATLLKKRLWHRCFPVNFVKFLRTSFTTEHFWWLLLVFRIEYFLPLGIIPFTVFEIYYVD